MTLTQMAYIKPSKNDGIPYIIILTEWPLGFVDATFNNGLVGGHTPQGHVTKKRQDKYLIFTQGALFARFSRAELH